ncbi:MAG: NUDIX domain-containing protein [Clostridia bacterium]|nr:NUDIX domain-containing protein [Clostridia bacterium]
MERSCGAIVFTRREGQPLFVVVQEMAGAYSFPKGHMEGDETEEETARREIYEETGLRPQFLPGFREQDEYDLAERPGFRKRVTYFLAEFGDESLTPRPGEIRRILLLPYEQALPYFEHESSRRILSAAYDFLIENQEKRDGSLC